MSEDDRADRSRQERHNEDHVEHGRAGRDRHGGGCEIAHSGCEDDCRQIDVEYINEEPDGRRADHLALAPS